MTQEIRIRTSDEAEPDDSSFGSYTTIGTQRPLSHDEDNEEYQGTYRFADTEPRGALEEAAAEIVHGFEAASVDRRHTWREYDTEEFLRDVDYYPPDGYTGLRAPPVVSRDGGFKLVVEAEIAIDGNEFGVADSVKIATPADYARRDLIVATEDGLRVVSGEPFDRPTAGGVVETPTTASDKVAIGLVTVKEPVDGIPSSGIDVKSAAGESSDWQTVINR